MKKYVPFSKIAILACFLLLVTSSYSQTFEWYLDKYANGGGTIKNIDNSGIDITISGLVNEYTHPGMEDKIVTGINDQRFKSLSHNYEFTFSELVDLEFTVSEINVGACYNDKLVFTPTPLFNSASGVVIKDSLITPSTATGGTVIVKYSKIKNFSIKHGLGNGCNPGVIFFSALKINHKNVSINKFKRGPWVINKLVDKSLSISGQNSVARAVHFIDSKGQLINSKFENTGTEMLTIETSSFANGIYYVMVEFESGEMLREKIIIMH